MGFKQIRGYVRKKVFSLRFLDFPGALRTLRNLDGRNRAIVIAESLARVVAAIQIASVRWRSYLPSETQKLVLTDPVFVVLRFE